MVSTLTNSRMIAARLARRLAHADGKTLPEAEAAAAAASATRREARRKANGTGVPPLWWKILSSGTVQLTVALMASAYALYSREQ